MWKDYFSFNKRQRNGIIVLLALIIGMMIYLIIADYFPPAKANIDFSSFKNDVAKLKPVSDSSSNVIVPVKQDSTRQQTTIELNSADSSDFMALPQITPKLARTIIHFRDALGGYYRKKQLLEVYGMDSAYYSIIINRITLDVSKVERMDINKVTEKELAHHPYIHKKLAKAIYDYRKASGPFSKIQDLMKVDGIDEDKYAKLAPYITIGK
jgi:DNA uptake protein ComE-like DNA-binding protein